MVLLAIFLSRFEAVEITEMLRGYGIFASLDGEYYTAATYQSVTLGGYRLRVLAEDHAAASDILRACDAPSRDLYRTSPRPSLIWLLVMLIGAHAGAVALMGGGSFMAIALAFGVVTGTPVDPKGRPDYFLSEPSGKDA